MNKAPTDDYERIITTEDCTIQWLLGTHRSDTMRNRKEVYKALNPDDDWPDVDYDKMRLKKVYMRQSPKMKDEFADGLWYPCTGHHPRAVKATRLTFE